MKLILFLLAISFLFFGGRLLFRMYEEFSKQWTIIDARVVSFSLDGSAPGRPMGWSELTIEYEYVVNGKVFLNNTIIPGRTRHSVPETFAESIGLSRFGDSIRIQYSAVYPGCARVIFHTSYDLILPGVTAVISMVFSFLLIAYQNAILAALSRVLEKF